MLKKSLLALALAGTASFAANAVDNDITGAVGVALSKQGAANETSFPIASLTGTKLTYNFNDAAATTPVSTGDKLVVSVSGATFGLGTAVLATFVDAGAGNAIVAHATPVYTNSNTATITLGAVTGTLDTADAIDITGLIFEGTSAIASGKVEVTVHLVDSAGSTVFGSKKVTVFELKDQFTNVVASALDGAIQVSESRKEFAASATTDVLSLTVSETANATMTTYVEAQPTKVTYTISAERGFAYLDTDSDGTNDLAIVGASTLVNGQDTFVTTFSADKSQAIVTQTVVDTVAANAGLDTAVTITIPGGDSKTVINRDTFKVVSTEIAYADNASKAGTFTGTANLVAGEWTIAGGSIVNVTGMPFSSGISQYVVISNTSTSAGVAELVAFVDGASTSHTLTTPIAANGVSNLTTEIKALAVSQGWADKTVTFEIVVTVPKASISAHSLFYVAGDTDRQSLPVTVD